MQMNALRSANFAKLSSKRSTSDPYRVASISAGTPAGYCLSQIRSMSFPSFLARLAFAVLLFAVLLLTPWAVLLVVPGLGLDGLFPASIGPHDRHGKRPERPWWMVDERRGR